MAISCAQNAPDIDPLAGYLLEPAVADAVGVTVNTLRSWNAQRSGPPRVKIGRRIFYRADAFRDWLRSRETGSDAEALIASEGR